MLKKTSILLVVAVTLMIVALIPAAAQAPAPTLVPPTLFPTSIPPTAPPPSLDSALKRIRADKDKPRLTVGILYNAKPFASLAENGDVIGFEADLARAIAADWGVPSDMPLFKQVTRQNGVKMLLNGDIDLLMGQVIHSRELDKTLDFSDTIFVNHQVALALESYTKTDISNLGGETVGVVVGSAAESAIAEWQKVTGIQVNVKRLALFDDGIKALSSGQINVFVDDRWNLDAQVGGGKVTGVKLLNGSFRDEPYAIAMRPYDDSLRSLVNRTLQRLARTDRFDQVYDSRLDQIYEQHFSRNDLPPDQRARPIIWKSLDEDKRSIDDFPTDIVIPAQSVLQTMAAQKVIRVTGIGAPDASGKLSALDTLNQALVNEIARRWGVTVQIVPVSAGSPEDLLASGGVDLAVGISAHWGSTETPDRVDFVGIYATHGYRLMVVPIRKITGFSDLLTNKNLGIFNDDPGAFPIAEKIAKTAGVINLQKVPLSSESDIPNLVANGTMSAIFADSLRAVPYAQANPNLVAVLDKEYTREPVAFAVPRNDSDFRALVETTLQDMAHDGTYQKIWKEQFNIGNPLSIGYWP